MAVLEGSQKIQRYKIGTGSISNLKVKQTSPGVMVVDIGKAMPSRPQVIIAPGVTGRKATVRHKGRVDPKAADPKDPGAYPMPSTKVNWPTTDKNAQKGYVVGKAWPTKTVQGAGPNPYRSEANENNPTQADGANAQDMDGPA